MIQNIDRTPSDEPRNGEDVLYAYFNGEYKYGTRLEIDDLFYEIEIDEDRLVRLINPCSDPRYSWERIRNHLEIDWGDGTVDKWFGRVINSGRFNRDSIFIPSHEYKNADIGDKFTIRVRCREPLTPIYCKVTSIYGKFPEDNYRIYEDERNKKPVGLFGVCKHKDYPEITYLNRHRDSVITLGPDLLDNWRNTDMSHMFSYFTALREIPRGFFKYLLGNVKSYYYCFAWCDSLVDVDKDLLGLSNNVVKDIGYMFYNNVSLKNTLHLQNSDSLVYTKQMYRQCRSITSVEEGFLENCPNIVNAAATFMSCNNLSVVSRKCLYKSTKIEEIQQILYLTSVTDTYITLENKTKVFDATSMYAACYKLQNISQRFFRNASTESAKNVTYSHMFHNSGDRDVGCIVPEKLFEPLGNISKLENINAILALFFIRGNDLPKYLFHNSFPESKHINRNILTSGLFSYMTFITDKDTIELKNEIFTGDQSSLRVLNDLFFRLDYNKSSESRNFIGYINKDYFKNCINLERVTSLFASNVFRCKIPENIFANNKKINSFKWLFNGCNFKTEYSIIDYVVRSTDVGEVDMSGMFGISNARTYRPIHWSASRTAKYRLDGIFDQAVSDITVPLEFILDGRDMVEDSTYTFEHKPSTIEYVVKPSIISEKKVTVGFKEEISSTQTPSTAYIDWGDGNTEEWTPSTTGDTLEHIYANIDVYTIKIKSSQTAYFVYGGGSSASNYNDGYGAIEIRGEYPYGSFDRMSDRFIYSDKINDNLYLWNVRYIDETVFRISRADGSDSMMCGLHISTPYIHPYVLKYGNNIKELRVNKRNKTEFTDANYPYFDIPRMIHTLPPRFYENCINLESLENALVYDVQMVPENIFPDVNYSNNKVRTKFMGGNKARYYDIIWKHHVKKSMYKDWMLDEEKVERTQSDFYRSYPLLPYGDNWEYFELADDQLYEKLTFVIKDLSVERLGLNRLAVGHIGEIKVEIYMDNDVIKKTLYIGSDNDLVECIGNISGSLTVINIYSKIPLWLDNREIISEVRGVIPECVLVDKFKELAPNVERISETLFYRVRNTNFDYMFKDCSKLEHVPSTLFHCNINANSFVGTFENCTSLFRVDDYMLICYDHDIDCRDMFKGCTGITYVYRPICTSVLGRVNVEGMFSGCKTTAFDVNEEADPQVFNGVWYIGNSGLDYEAVDPAYKRALVNKPTILTSGDIAVKNKWTDSEIKNAETSVYIGKWDDMFNGVIDMTDEQVEKLGRAICGKVQWYSYDQKKPFVRPDDIILRISAKNILNLNKYMWNLIWINHNRTQYGSHYLEKDNINGLDLKYLLFYSERTRMMWGQMNYIKVRLPIHSYQFKMVNSPWSLPTLEWSTIMNNGSLKYFLDENIETCAFLAHVIAGCNNKISDGVFVDDFKFGKHSPNMISSPIYPGSPNNVYSQFKVRNDVYENLFNNHRIFRDTNIGKDYQVLVTAYYGNGLIDNDLGILQKILNHNVYEQADGTRHIPGVFANCGSLVNVSNDIFENIDLSKKWRFNSTFYGAPLKNLPRINHIPELVSFEFVYKSCRNFEIGSIPQDYIRSIYDGVCSIESCFENTNLQVNNQFIDQTSTATFMVKNSLKGLVSTIGDDPEIFAGIKYDTDPEKHSGVKSSVNIRFVDKEYNRVLYEGIFPYGERLQIDIYDTRYLKVDQYGMAVGFKIDDGVLGVDGVHKEYFDRVVTSDIEIECEMIRFDYFIKTTDNLSSQIDNILSVNNNDLTGKIIGFDDSVTEVDSMFLLKPITKAPDIIAGRRVWTLRSCFDSTSITSIPEKVFYYMKALTGVPATLRVTSNLTEVPMKLFWNNTNLVYIHVLFRKSGIQTLHPDIFKYNTKVTNIEYLFAECSRLTTLPDRLLGTMTKITTAKYAFRNSGITAIPPYLLNNLTELVYINEIFMGTSIKNIPSTLFTKNTKLIDVGSAFKESTIEQIPDDLFSANVNIESFQSTFESTPITSIPSTLFATNTKARIFTSTFKLCSGITSVHEDLFKFNNLVELFDYTFEGTSLNIIPATLFSGKNKCTSIRGCFYKTKITTLPNRLLYDMVALEDSRICFADMPLTQIPNDIFKNNLKLSNLNHCFYKTQITSIPDNLFINNPLIFDIEACFAVNTKLNTIPINIFDNLNKLTNVTRCLYACSNLTSKVPELWKRGTIDRHTEYGWNCVKAANYIDIPVDWGGPVTHIVTFNVGNLAQPINPIKVITNTTVTLPKVTPNKQHGFIGWFTDAGFTRPFNPSTPITANITLYAKIINIPYVKVYSARVSDTNGANKVFTRSIQLESVIATNKIRLEHVFGTNGMTIDGVYPLANYNASRIADNIDSDIDITKLNSSIDSDGIIKLGIRYK